MLIDEQYHHLTQIEQMCSGRTCGLFAKNIIKMQGGYNNLQEKKTSTSNVFRVSSVDREKKLVNRATRKLLTQNKCRDIDFVAPPKNDSNTTAA